MSKKVTDLDALTVVADGDLLHIIDVSDTSGTPQGTSKKIAFSDLKSIFVTEWESSTSKTLNATPLVITGGEAPAAGYAKVPIAVAFGLDYNSAAYDFGAAGIYIAYASAATTSLATIAQASINSASDVKKFFAGQTSPNMLNSNLVLSASADATAGDSPYYYKVYYRLIELPF